MKILQLLCFPLYGSGSGTYARKLAVFLNDLSHDVAIVCPDNRRIPDIKIYEVKLPFMAVFTGHPEHPEAKLYSELTPGELNKLQVAFQDAIISAVKDFKPDVIHVHHASNLSWIANYIKAVYQINYIVTSHNTDVINAILDRRYIPLTRDALNRAEVIIAVSKNTRERLLKAFGTKRIKLASKIKVIPTGVDTANFPDFGPTNRVNKRFRLNGKKVVLYSGKITPIKGVDLFIKAAKNFPNAVFVITGTGDDLKKMQNLAKDHGIGNIIFTGYLGAKDSNLVSELYRRADIVCVPSTLSEGIPLSVLEAMSSGTLVIASNIGGIPTVIKHMKNGLLIQPRSLPSLVKALEIGLNNEKLAGQLSKNAHLDALRKYDWRVIAKKMTKFYQLTYERGQKMRDTKKPPHISKEEYDKDKKLIEEFGKIE